MLIYVENPKESHGQRSLVGYSSPCDHKELDTVAINTFTEQQEFSYIAGGMQSAAFGRLLVS